MGDTACIALAALVAIVSVLKVPAMPVNDPAFYEWSGWAMTHGERLYTDFTDQKLPSIFLVNALWQWLFPTNYQLHAWVEGGINLVVFALFALLLRGNRVAAWAQATLLFAVAYSLPFPQFNYPEHYAVLFIVLAYWLAFRKQNVLAGASLAIAATFWPPAALGLVPPLARRVSRNEKLAFTGGFAGLGIIGLLAAMPLLGPVWFMKPLMNALGGLTGLDAVQLHTTFFVSALGPAILSLLLLLWLVARDVENEAQAFALWWAVVALMGTAIPPKFSEHYFLPSVPALSMAVGAFGFPRGSVRARPVAAILLAASLIFTVRNAVVVTAAALPYGRTVEALSRSVLSSIGPGHVLWTSEYAPELFLATLSVQAGPLTIHGQESGFGAASGASTDLAIAKDQWLHYPDLVIYGPYKPLRRQRLALLNWSLLGGPPYVAVCPRQYGPFAVYATAELSRRLSCATAQTP